MSAPGNPQNPRHPLTGQPAGAQGAPSSAASGSLPVGNPPLSPASATSTNNPDAAGGTGGSLSSSLEALAGVPVTLRVLAGKGTMPFGRLKTLAPGQTLPLGQAADAPIAFECEGIHLGAVEVEARGDTLVARVASLAEGDDE